MIKLLKFIFLNLYFFYYCECGSLPATQQVEQTLINSLLSGYNKNIRPEDQVEVYINALIQQIVSIDEKQQIMTSSSFISQSWTDSRLSWTPSNVSNINVVMLPVKSIWIPDTMILNSADTSGYFAINDYSMASVLYTGDVYMILPALAVKTRCPFFVQMFPFDRQICPINLTSWSQGSNRIQYTENSSLVIDISEYSEHPLWQLNGTDMIVFRTSDRSPYEDTYNSVISIQLYLRRKPLFFILNGIFACLVLNCVTLLSYALPFGSQIGLCMVCFMTYSVYSLNFSNLFPQQSQYIMMITLYFLLSICWTLISMGWFVLSNHFQTKSEMPKIFYNLAALLEKLLCCCFPPPKKDEKDKDKNKDTPVKDAEVKTTENVQNGNTEGNTPKVRCVCCHKLFIACLQNRVKVENVAEKTETPVQIFEPAKTKEKETLVDNLEPTKADENEIKPIETVAEEPAKEVPKEEKPKCNFCNRCEACQADFDKDKAKGKNKKDIESKCSALNYLVFFFILLSMFISNMCVWLLMSR